MLKNHIVGANDYLIKMALFP